MAERRHQVLVIGGGTGGISVAARLCRAMRNPDVAVLEPTDVHYYQPAWTLVGGLAFDKRKTARPMASVMPRKATWIRDAAASIDPDQRVVTTRGGDSIRYERLVVAAGLSLLWDRIPGLREGLGRHGVCSNYSFDTVDFTRKAISEFQGGTAIFTHPSTPIKCGGAPQKIMYLADDYWRRKGIRGKCRIVFVMHELDEIPLAHRRVVVEPAEVRRVPARDGLELRGPWRLRRAERAQQRNERRPVRARRSRREQDLVRLSEYFFSRFTEESCGGGVTQHIAAIEILGKYRLARICTDCFQQQESRRAFVGSALDSVQKATQ